MASHLPTPSPSPPPLAASPTTLSTQINVATRKRHTQLNKLIAERLPLALPPHASDPKLLHRGLALFSDIYMAFEFAWHEITHPELFPYSRSSKRSQHEAEVLRLLTDLRPGGLERMPRITRDMERMESVTGVDYDEAGVPTRVIIEAIQQKPHIAVAYAWVMYMAVFSGGRWIRQQFANAGPEFWTGQSETARAEKDGIPQAPELPGFSFLSFDGDADGEDIKAEFKSRLAVADTLLTQQEKQDVIETADGLFELCIELVGELDRRIWWSKLYRFVPTILTLIVLLFGLLVLYWVDNFGYLHH